MEQIVKLGFQLGFGLWGLFLCGSFLYAGKRVLGILGYSSSNSDGPGGPPPVNEKGVAGLMMAGMMAPGQNLASSLTAALAPTLLQSTTHTPKIKITDENDRTVSVASDSSRLNDTSEGLISAGNQSQPIPRPSTPIALPSSFVKGSGHARPPSPVLPRKKSAGSSTVLRNSSGSGPSALVGD